MSKYTSELSFICASLAGYTDELTAPGYRTVIEKARPLIFDFSYPIWDEAKRAEFETKILRHFYTYEIGFETYGLWKLRLDDWLNTNMPYFNPLYKAVEKEYGVFTTDDFTIESKEDTKHDDVNTSTHDKTSTGTASGEGTSDYNSNSKSNEDSTNSHTDTPQGSLDNFLAGEYLSDASHMNGSSSNNFTSGNKSKSNSTSTLMDNTQDSENRKGEENRTLLHTEKGFRGRSASSLFKDYMEANANIDQKLFEAMAPLFMLIW